MEEIRVLEEERYKWEIYRIVSCANALRIVRARSGLYLCRDVPMWASMQITNGTPAKPDRNEWTRRDAPFIGNAQKK